ncbi:integrase [Bacillus sp. FJAT-42376]|uniref:tyrosine-type recombinase/integrase n=1 Tax=Bacillus sp. FJAT-42376 TaxID=2014076 RepID=UPI000F4E7904|nr:tyrosine-type recombinase/integrase [Bacillus sp. FJAT-42376]AZB43497.1 integrase [Bacillus sp. FJAT-42376]
MAKSQTNEGRKFNFKSRSVPRKNIDLQAEIERFLAAKRSEGRSERTIKTYRQALLHFNGWYAERPDAALTTDTLRGYFDYMKNEKQKWDDHPTNSSEVIGVSARSLNNLRRNLNVLFNFLVSERIIAQNPLASIKPFIDNEDTFAVFSDEDVLRLLEAPNKRVYTGFRDYAMMLVLIDTGLRINELTNLRVSDFDMTLRQITVRPEIAKTRTTRIVPISIRTLKTVLQLVDFINVESSDYLFLTQFGERYMADTFAKMLKQYAKRVGVTGVRVSPHTFRHYMAVKFLKSGGDPFTLMRILGHADISMTNRYVKYTNTDIQTQHDKASPVQNLIDSGNDRKRGRKKFM